MISTALLHTSHQNIKHHMKHLSHFSSEDNHWRDNFTYESEPPSFRHMLRQTTEKHCHCHCHGHESTTCANDTSVTVLSPESTPPQSPDSSWSFCSPAPTPPPLTTHRCLLTLRHHDGDIHSIAVAKGLVFTGSNSSYIRAWQQLDLIENGYIRTSSGEVNAMLAHGNMLFTSHKDHKIRAWTIPSSPELKTTSAPCTCCHNNDNNSNNIIDPFILPRKITTLPKTTPLRFLLPKSKQNQFHKDVISCMAYNMAEGILYTGSYDKTVKAWRINDRKCIDSFAAHAEDINDMVITDEGYLFTCSSDRTLKMWSIVSGETFHTLTMTLHFHPFPIYTLALSKACTSEGCFLYAGSSDGCIYYWEQEISGEYVRRGFIQAHQLGVLCLTAFGDLVISGSADRVIKLWKRGNDWKPYECVGVLEGHKGPVKCIAATACLEEGDGFGRGILVFSAGLDRTFKVWKVKVLKDTTTKRRTTQLDCDDSDGDDNHFANRRESEEVEIVSPILSPSWVKKVQGGTR